MILRVDRLQIEMDLPEQPDPAAAAAVQELLGGRFGEMSTFMNYTFQSWNFRGREKVRPYYELIANIGTEEYGHVELVASTVNGMLTGASSGGDVTDTPLAGVMPAPNPHHFIVQGQSAAPANSLGQPWQGDYVFNSGDLVLDLLHNFFLECGARTHKIRVYEMTDHPIARQMLGYLFVRGGVHALAYAKALEELTGATVWKLLNIPNVPNSKFPETKQWEDQASHRTLYRFSETDFNNLGAVWKGTHPDDGEEVFVEQGPPDVGGQPADFPESPEHFVPGYDVGELAEIAKRMMDGSSGSVSMSGAGAGSAFGGQGDGDRGEGGGAREGGLVDKAKDKLSGGDR
jgi:Mn-containing catalase